jgi:4-cresol dehydrogenase (hydroxylating)
MPPRAALRAALEDIFPSARMTTDTAGIAAWTATTHPIEALPAAIVMPLDEAELRAALRAARAAGATVAATSQGRNIGLGGRVPPQASAACVLIDLRAMGSIRAIDEQAGTVTVEPGVTFRDLHRALRARGSRWFLPATGGPQDGSIVGNLLERGDGTGPYGDRTRAFLDLRAVLASGEIVSTSRDSAGPDFSGLFFQSSAGIVTAAAVQLARLPNVMTRFVLRVPAASLAPLVDAARAAVRDGIMLPGAACIWNGTKRMLRDGAKGGGEGWTMSGALHAASQARATADWNDLLAACRTAGAAIDIVHHEIAAPCTGEGLLEGEPSDANMVSILSGLRDGAGTPGFAWLCPVLPNDGAAATYAMSLTAAALGEAGMPANLALGCRDARTLRGYIALAWNRDDADAEQRALQTHDALLARLQDAGFPAFRLGTLSYGWSAPARDDTPRVLARLRAALDN